MNPTDEQMLRQQLHSQLAALPVRPAPLHEIASRGRSIRARRRGVAATCVTATAGVAAVLVAVPSLLPGSTHGRQVVTINTPDQHAPGGVFASGTANGKPWQLSVRNIADTCSSNIPAVMLNGRDGDVLFAGGYPPSALLNTRFAAPHQIPGQVPGEPSVGFGFARVRRDVTRVDVTVSGGKQFSVVPVSVTQCGPYRLAGFAYQGSGVTRLTAIPGHGHSYRVPLPPSRTGGPPGTWANPESRQPAAATLVIGAGTVQGVSWRITASLLPSGDCYSLSLSKGGATSSTHECLPVAATAAGMTGVNLPVTPLPGVPVTGGLKAYAGLVRPGTARVTVKLSDGTSIRQRAFGIPGILGRGYVGFVLPPATTLTRLTLHGAGGQDLGTYTSITPAQPGGGTIAQSGSSSASAPPQVSASPGRSSR